MTGIYNSINRAALDFETRRVQSNGRSLVTVIPKSYTDYLEIERGDLIKFQLRKDPAGRSKITMEKINLENDDPGKRTMITTMS